MYGELSIFTGNAHPQLARDICAYLGVPLGKAEVFEFSNENIFVKINQNVREHDVFVVQPTCSPVNKSVMELLIMLDALKRASASRITAVIPYFAYGRSDKKDQPRVPITARLLAELLQVAGADRVLTMDLHAGQVQGFFRIPVDELTAMYPLRRLLPRDGADRPGRRRGGPRLRQAGAQLRQHDRRLGRLRREAAARQRQLQRDARRDRRRRGQDGHHHGRRDRHRRARSPTPPRSCVEGARDVIAACTHAVLSGARPSSASRTARSRAHHHRHLPHRPRQADVEDAHVLPIGLHLGEAISRIHTGGSVGALFGVPGLADRPEIRTRGRARPGSWHPR